MTSWSKLTCKGRERKCSHFMFQLRKVKSKKVKRRKLLLRRNVQTVTKYSILMTKTPVLTALDKKKRKIRTTFAAAFTKW